MPFDSMRNPGGMLRLVAWIAAVLALCACGKKDTPNPPQAAGGAPVHDHGSPEAQPTPSGEILSASLITIAYDSVKEYSSRRPRPSRSKTEALALAREIVAALRNDASQFEELARTRSEDPLAPEGGGLPGFRAGDNPEIERTLVQLAEGEISDPVDSDYGYRIVRRDPPLPDEIIAARHLVVAFAGAVRASSSIARTRDEARVRAVDLAARAKQDPDGFEALIRAESDGWDKNRLGHLGTWKMNGGRFPAAFDRAIFALQPGEVSVPIESQFGYQIFQRIMAGDRPLQIAGAHILIAFRGAVRARPNVTRSKDEAERLSRRIFSEVRADPSRFAGVAREQSDDATAARGGDFGTLRHGAMPAAFEQAMARLNPGEVGGPVLTEFGYHVLLRREAPEEKNYVTR